jgi:hypothetical protein
MVWVRVSVSKNVIYQPQEVTKTEGCLRQHKLNMVRPKVITLSGADSSWLNIILRCCWKMVTWTCGSPPPLGPLKEVLGDDLGGGSVGSRRRPLPSLLDSFSAKILIHLVLVLRFFLPSAVISIHLVLDWSLYSFSANISIHFILV